MVTTGSNVGVFDQSMYISLNDRVTRFFREDPEINWLPFARADKLHAPQYKKPIYGGSQGIRGAHKLGIPNLTMKTPQDTRTYNLEYQYGDIVYDYEDMMTEGQYLVQRKAQELRTIETGAKLGIFKGVFTDGFSTANAGVGDRLNDGIIEQATLVENLNGLDSLLDAAGDVYLALNKIFTTIPFKYRENHRILIGCDDLFANMARKALFRGATNQISEFDLWFQEHASQVYAPGVMQNLVGQQVAGAPLISDALFLNTKAGTTKTEVDTLGTHSRLFAAAVDPEIIEQAYSFVGMMGEDRVNSVQLVNQRWAARESGCVHVAEAVVFSERISWA